MSARRPGARRVTEGVRLLSEIDFTETLIEVDVEAAKAWALLAVADALGAIARELELKRQAES